MQLLPDQRPDLDALEKWSRDYCLHRVVKKLGQAAWASMALQVGAVTTIHNPLIAHVMVAKSRQIAAQTQTLSTADAQLALVDALFEALTPPVAPTKADHGPTTPPEPPAQPSVPGPSVHAPAGYPSHTPAGYPPQPPAEPSVKAPAGYPPQAPAGYPPHTPAGYPLPTPAGYPLHAPAGHLPQVPRGLDHPYPGNSSRYSPTRSSSRLSTSIPGWVVHPWRISSTPTMLREVFHL